MSRPSPVRDARFACDLVHRHAMFIVAGTLIADIEELRALHSRGRETLRVAVALVDALPRTTPAKTLAPMRSHLDAALLAMEYVAKEIDRRSAEVRQ